MAPSDCYQVQVHVRDMIDKIEIEEMLMLIGIDVRSVTSKKPCALDGDPSCERCETRGAQERENRKRKQIRW